MKGLLIFGFIFLSIPLLKAQQLIARYSYHDNDNNQLKEIFHVRDTFNNVLEGPYFSYHLNGNIESKGQFSNNETVGVWEFYYETGKLKMRGALRNNSNYGNWEYFYENGNKQMEGKIINRKREGPWKMYYESGELKSVGGFSENKRSGLWKTYYESGELKGEIEYVADRGKYIEYYYTGEKKAEGPKVGLISTGHWVFYFKSGEKQAEGKYLKGNRTGEWIFYHPDGYISSKGNYEDNEPSGKWKYYFKSGELSAEGVFRKGKKEGIWNAYYPGGNLKSSTKYSGETSAFKEFHEDGGLKVSGTLSDGKKNGSWKYYYSGGELEGEIEFENGQGIYTGYYKEGPIYIKGLIENDQRVGTWEIYDKSGTLKGYYKPFYKNNSLDLNDFKKVNQKRKSYGVADYGFKTQKFHYFKPKLNEYSGIILSTNPLTPFIGKLPVGIELYYQERLGYEILIEGIRDPFYVANEKVRENFIYTRGIGGSFRQKFYNSDNRLGLFYFGHSLSYYNLNHRVNVAEQSSEIIKTEGAKEVKYIYSIVAGYRLMEYTYRRGFTLDGFIGLGSGYRTFKTTDENTKHFESLSRNNIPVDFKFGVTFGYSYPFKRKR